jgi:hypothetical protein
MGVKKIGLGGGGGTFDGTMDDIPNGTTYVKTENNLTDAEKTILSNTSGTNSGDNAVNSLYSGLATSKQDALVSGTNIKTINSATLLGSGDIAVQPTLVSGTTIKTINSTTLLGSGDVAVQSTLVSGTNIKTINGSSVLGSGDLTIGASLTSAQAFCTAETTLSAATYADITGASISLTAGTWIIFATANGSSQTTTATSMIIAITDNANTIIAEAAQDIAAGTATVRTWGNLSLSAIVSPTGTTTYKLRGARGQTTRTGNCIISDGTGQGTANNVSNNSDKSTSIRAIKIA